MSIEDGIDFSEFTNCGVTPANASVSFVHIELKDFFRKAGTP